MTIRIHLKKNPDKDGLVSVETLIENNFYSIVSEGYFIKFC